jgi:hypothetical protein
MRNEPADRHVLAGAAASDDAHTIVTSNLRHVSVAPCEPFGIEILHPDAFLCQLDEREPGKVHAAFAE